MVSDVTDSALPCRGRVYLVGAGPGDPDLLTIKALRLLQSADIVLYDRLVSQPILDLINLKAERVYVGKQRQNHALAQSDINQALVDYALQGLSVVRLKGGDPFIFGRGGEEIERLHQHNIHFEVVPGITAASGCAAYSGIPLTHRDHAHSVKFITGHTQHHTLELDWSALQNDRETLVFYMGLVHLDDICQGLIDHGRAAHTPAALIEKGSTPSQRMVVSTLEQLPREVANAELKAPTLLIIGSVVTLHKTLNWFDDDVITKL